MPSSPETITIRGHGPPETIYGAFRGLFCVAGFVAIAWIDHGVAKHAIGGIALVASPALARAIIAPFLAKVLRKAAQEYVGASDPSLTVSGNANRSQGNQS